MTKIQKCYLAYWYYVMCHNLKPLKINDENPPSISKTNIFQTFFICHMSLCKLLTFVVIYKWHIIIYGWWNILLVVDFIHTCNYCIIQHVYAISQFLVANVFCNQNIVANGSCFFPIFFYGYPPSFLSLIRHNMYMLMLFFGNS